MNRIIFVAGAVVAAMGLLRLANPPVDLQATSPGVPQSGNANITGRLLAGSVAAADGSLGGIAVQGNASDTASSNYGGLFKSASPNGRGVRGYNLASGGGGIGGDFQADGPTGTAVRAIAASASGANVGVFAKTNSPAGLAGSFVGNVNVSGSLSASGHVGNGSALTNLNASSLASGSVPDLRLSSNVAMRNASNVFAGTNQFTGSTYVGPRTSHIGTGEILGLSTTTPGYGGMYISTPVNGMPYYGYVSGATTAWTYMNGDGDLLFNVGSERMVIQPDGKVGIGTIAPGSTLHVVDNNAATQGSLRTVNGVPSVYSSGRIAANSQAAGSDQFVLGSIGTAEGTSTGYAYGLYGYASGSGSGTHAGVFGGVGGGSGDLYAGFFQGLLYAVSSSAGVKSFLIDHPLDPENKYLEHSSVESDERMNIYRGIVVTDFRGYATITVPDWFEALNEDIMYQLTVIDTSDSADFTLAKVVKELAEGSFKIRTSTARAKISWQITGRRHDPTSKHHPLQVERPKEGEARGRYLDPEAYGKDLGSAIAKPAVRPDQVQPEPKRK